MIHLRVFVSSPGDVGSERAIAVAALERLQLEFRGLATLEIFLWERSLLRATDTFQAQIVDVQETDLAVFILWSRMGTPLPPDRFCRADGTPYRSGTEYEFERAMDGYAKHRRPDILFYVKTAEVRLAISDRDHRNRGIAEIDAVMRFIDKWFLDSNGLFKAAYYQFHNAARFEELLELHLREWIRDRLRVTDRNVVAPSWTGSPFRGLQSFDIEHALIFCGRTRQVADVLETLRRRADEGRAFLMVVGMSGAGKSSLLRAGVLPLLARPRAIERVLVWRRAVFRPGSNQGGLLAGMMVALTSREAVPELVEATDSADPQWRDPVVIAKSITRALESATRKLRAENGDAESDDSVRLVVLVDQFEEIFDDSFAAEERRAFADAVTAIATSGTAWVIATLRADFYSRCAELPEGFRDLMIGRGGLFPLGGPRRAEISQMITRPAALAGLKYERRGDPEEGLDDLLCDTAAEHPTILPLLEFTLDELWKRNGESGLLRFSDYEELGGLYGALRQRADEEFNRLPASARAALAVVLAALVRVDPVDERLLVHSRVPFAQISQAPGCAMLVKTFIDARLMVADGTSDETSVVGLAHEALLREWPPASQWIERNREMLRLRAGIAAAAALWRSAPARADRLLTGALMKDAERLLVTKPEVFTAEERHFVTISAVAVRRGNRRRLLMGCAVAGAVAMTVMIAGVGFDRLNYSASILWLLPDAWSAGIEVPVSREGYAALQASIASLTSHLIPRLEDIGVKPELVGWTVAEMWMALDGPGGSLVIDAAHMHAFMTEQMDPLCQCWHETPDKFPHTVATAWIVYALGAHGQTAGIEVLDAMLNRQAPEGWWSMFFSVPPVLGATISAATHPPEISDSRNASVAATAWTVLALQEQYAAGLVDPQRGPRVVAAIRRGASWLRAQALPGKARWREYPLGDRSEGSSDDYLAISALVVHVIATLSQAGQVDPQWAREFEVQWLDELPPYPPAPRFAETAKGIVYLSNSQITLDEVRHYQYPWMLRVTADAFPQGNIMQKARAMLWIDDALRHAPQAQDLRSEDWTISEILFALHSIETRIKMTMASHDNR